MIQNIENFIQDGILHNSTTIEYKEWNKFLTEHNKLDEYQQNERNNMQTKITAESLKSIEQRKYLTIKESSLYLEVSESLVRNLITNKKLKAFSTGKSNHPKARFSNIRIKRTDLDKIMKEIKIIE